MTGHHRVLPRVPPRVLPQAPQLRAASTGRQTPSLVSLLMIAATLFTGATSDSTLSSKRGLAFRGDDHGSDNSLLLSQNSTISWYYTWSAHPSPLINNTLTFVPLLHGLDDASDKDVLRTLDGLPSSSTHLLTFNEPDGTTTSGGSAISPEDAARVYLADIAPLQSSSSSSKGKSSEARRTWNISHPSVTGSDRGLDWLRKFNESCFDIKPDGGCPADFVAVHWYGDAAGLESWLGRLRDFYGESVHKFWVTEMALPKGDDGATLEMMRKSLEYLDGQEDVEGYAWFGAFREDEANAWTGGNVALFDGKGGLTELGAMYLGGKEKGFEEGKKGSGASGGHGVRPLWMMPVWLGTMALVL